MTLIEFISSISAGGVVAVLVIILSLIEIVPIKVSPLAFIGKRLNKETLERVKTLEKTLNEHTAQSSRSMILNFDEELTRNNPKTKEQWKTVVNAIYDYEKHCNENKITNGFCEEASKHILTEYQKRLQNNNF